MTWVKGQSGNPAGTKPKSRALAEVLRVGGAERLDVGKGKTVTNKEELSRLVWQGIVDGRLEFHHGRIVDLDAQEWRELVKLVLNHVDGPPRQELDVTSNGETLIYQFIERPAGGTVSGADGIPAE